MDDLKSYWAPLLHYIKLCASSQTPRWIQTGVTVRKRSIRVKISDFFVPCDLEISWMTLKTNRAPLLCCFKLCTSFHSHRWIQTKVTVRKRSIRVKIGNLLSHVTLKFDGWLWKFRSHWWIQTGVTVWKRPIWVKINNFFEPCDLEIWWMTLKNNRAPFLSNIKLYASFHHHMWIQTGVTVGKLLNWVMISVTLTFDLWPWPFAWTSIPSLVITCHEASCTAYLLLLSCLLHIG